MTGCSPFQNPFAVSVYPTKLSASLSVYVSAWTYVNLVPVHVVQTFPWGEHMVILARKTAIGQRAITRSMTPHLAIFETYRRSATKEPTGLLRGYSKHSDGLTFVPWHCIRCLNWDATVAETFATSYLSHTLSTPGSATEASATRKNSKYSTISKTH